MPLVRALDLGSSTPDPATPSPDAGRTIDGSRLHLSSIMQGQPPSVAWLDGDDYVAADGDRTTLPLDGVTTATPYQGGFLAVVTGPDLGPRVVRLDGDLDEMSRQCGQGAFAVSQDGGQTAYTSGDCRSADTTLHLGPTDGSDEQTTTLPLEESIPTGILGDSVVVSSVVAGPSTLVEPDGTPARISGLSTVSGVDGAHGVVSGQLAGQERTGAVLDPVTGAVQWTAKGWQLGRFSPDGSLVLGTQTSRGFPIAFAIFDVYTGAQVHQFGQLADFRTHAVAWEDTGHLLMATTQGRTQAILRTTLDGGVERASDVAPYDGSSDYLEFRFAPRP